MTGVSETISVCACIYPVAIVCLSWLHRADKSFWGRLPVFKNSRQNIVTECQTQLGQRVQKVTTPKRLVRDPPPLQFIMAQPAANPILAFGGPNMTSFFSCQIYRFDSQTIFPNNSFHPDSMTQVWLSRAYLELVFYTRIVLSLWNLYEEIMLGHEILPLNLNLLAVNWAKTVGAISLQLTLLQA